MRRPGFIARQSRCPTGLLGRLIGHIISAETASANAEAERRHTGRAPDASAALSGLPPYRGSP